MKLSHLVVASSLVASADAFVPVMHQRRAFVPFRMTTTEEESAPPEEAAAAPVAEVSPDTTPSSSPYERLGVSEDKVALGVDASEIYQWLGSREDIIEKFLQDNKSFDRARAEMEVDKFLMDAEMLTAYIKFEEKQATNPQSLKEEAIGNISDPKTIATYAAWIVGGAAFSFIRKNFVDPKFASGEWEPLRINIGGLFGDKGADAVADSVDAVQSTVDAASNSL